MKKSASSINLDGSWCIGGPAILDHAILAHAIPWKLKPTVRG